jgi:hopanoid biosynthesis associated radical SAM protein HpnH
MVRVVSYIAGQKLRGRRRYPLVLMLEPLYRCNLACAGCGKIQYPAHVLRRQLSVEECMRAVDECPAPVVSIPGGEPLLHPEIDAIVRGLVERRRYVYLCTNALLLEQKLDLFAPSRYLTFNVHLDGLEEEHDASVCRPGTYRIACRAVERALERGFRVTTNTTLFEGADPARTARFFDAMMDLGVEGMTVSPGYQYQKAPDQEHFLARERTVELFRRIFSAPRRRRWRFNQSPLFLEFLLGARRYDCTPWGNPSYGVFGWQKPCYLLQEGYASSFQELLDETRWQDYGHASGNPSCRNCMVHSGFEASAVEDGFSSLRGFFAMARAAFFGPRVPAPAAARAGVRGAGREEARGGAYEPASSDAPAPAEPEPRSSSPSPEAPSPPARGFAAEATEDSLRIAFDYRGDVTLTLADGSAREGYVAGVSETEVRLLRKGERAALRIPRAQVARVALTGRDTAAPPG